ncbi:LOW QUALITY PROTEIN: ankyrin repeat containing protein / TPR domain-containing protein, putative [Eimeria mitis]|uniref:Ankyrin repeat containing protein / TPR domain-containing protein, putative n=1 Tax=Eimeria mitis TaxID=44415 RepID=U6K205_9EIME|nr:LOW QUALITY PROTEIN: ankyrin repeat containing protein / TPR domain-containing protein, putative [Eimeria mitis]CDJ31780.1 ankyrin repeat containing protein / TPR domain-containing protein, putative [Eimeria mitis]
MSGRRKASKSPQANNGCGDAACGANSASSEVPGGDKCGSLMEDRALLTNLLEAAASGNKDSLLAAINKVAQKYGTRNASGTETPASATPEEGESAAAGAKGPAATAPQAAEGTECGKFGLIPDLLLGFRDGEGRTVAHFAALGGSAEVLELVLRVCPSAPTARDSYGKTPLFTAASLGNTEMLKLLLDSGGDAAARSKGGSTAVHEAIYWTAVETLQREAKPNTTSSMGTPLQIAAVTQQQEILKLLLSHGADPNNCPGSDPGTDPTVDTGRDSNASVSYSSPFPPALILAASKNDCSCLQLLLEHGADYNATDSEGFTALHCAAETNCVKCAEQLLKAGADWGIAAAVRGRIDSPRLGEAPAVAQLLEPLGLSPQQKRPPPQRPSSNQRPAAAEAERTGPTGSTDGPAEGAKQAPPVLITLDPTAPAPPEAVARVEKLKEAGNAAFRKGDFAAAKVKYSEAIEECPKVAAARELLGVLYSNRSFTHEQLEDAHGALEDAQAAAQLRPEWSKAQYRLARARRLEGAEEEYIAQLWEALRLDPANTQIQ